MKNFKYEILDDNNKVSSVVEVNKNNKDEYMQWGFYIKDKNDKNELINFVENIKTENAMDEAAKNMLKTEILKKIQELSNDK